MHWIMNGYFCPPPGHAVQCQEPAAALSPFVHERCAEMAVVCSNGTDVKARTIVLYYNRNPLGIATQLYLDQPGLRVAADIGQRFLYDANCLDLFLARQRTPAGDNKLGFDLTSVAKVVDTIGNGGNQVVIGGSLQQFTKGRPDLSHQLFAECFCGLQLRNRVAMCRMVKLFFYLV